MPLSASQLDEGRAFLVFERVEEDLKAHSISVEKLIALSRIGGEKTALNGESVAAVFTERPPVLTRNRDHTAVSSGSASTSAGSPFDVPFRAQ